MSTWMRSDPESHDKYQVVQGCKADEAQILMVHQLLHAQIAELLQCDKPERPLRQLLQPRHFRLGQAAHDVLTPIGLCRAARRTRPRARWYTSWCGSRSQSCCSGTA